MGSADDGGGGGGGGSVVGAPLSDQDPTRLYELLQPLGKGSYGAVYKARDLRSSELVAVKIINLGEGEESLDEIRGEIEMLQQCNHPNIVRYLGSYRGPDYLWIVMEYCGGGSIADIMHVREAPLDEAQIAYVCRETLKGLAYLHSIGKVHRDIKCGNILMTEQGEVKLADFGVAAQLTRTMSKRNTFIGTPHWMAPEVIQESRYDGTVDVWALGISAIEMAEVAPPRSNVHPMRVIFMISREPPPMLQEKEKWSLTFHDFVAQCLVKDSRLRPSSAQLLHHKLIERCKATAACLQPQIDALRQAMAEHAARLLQERGTSSSTGQLSWVGTSNQMTVDGRGGTVRMTPGGTSASGGSYVDEEYATFVMHRDSGTSTGTVRIMSAEQRERLRNDAPMFPHELMLDRALPPPRYTITARPSPAPSPHPAANADRADVPKSDKGMSEVAARLFGGNKPTHAASAAPPPPLRQMDMNGTVKVLDSYTATQLHSYDNSRVPSREQEMGSLRALNTALYDKLASVHAAGSTIPIPFLKASSIPSAAMLRQDPNVGEDSSAIAAVKELYYSAYGSTGKKGPNPELPQSVKQLLSRGTLPNLARALSYHKQCIDDLVLTPAQLAEHQHVVSDLSDTLKTILRL
eukprot:jgi/Chlat1/7405/Chrsp6S00594